MVGMATSHDSEIVELAYSLTGFQRDLLSAIQSEVGAAYGLACKRQVDAWYGVEQNHGRLYPNLDTLVDHGLVDKSELDKRTNQYALTEGGKAVLDVFADHYGATDE